MFSNIAWRRQLELKQKGIRVARLEQKRPHITRRSSRSRPNSLPTSKSVQALDTILRNLLDISSHAFMLARDRLDVGAVDLLHQPISLTFEHIAHLFQVPIHPFQVLNLLL